MLLLRHVSDLMAKSLRPRREPLDGLALLVSVGLHAGLLAWLGYLAALPTEPPEEPSITIAALPEEEIQERLARIASRAAAGSRSDQPGDPGPLQVRTGEPTREPRVVERALPEPVEVTPSAPRPRTGPAGTESPTQRPTPPDPPDVASPGQIMAQNVPQTTEAPRAAGPETAGVTEPAGTQPTAGLPAGPRTADLPRPQPGTADGDRDRGGLDGTSPDPLPDPATRVVREGSGTEPGTEPGTPDGTLTALPDLPTLGSPGGAPRGPASGAAADAVARAQTGDGGGSGELLTRDLGGGVTDLPASTSVGQTRVARAGTVTAAGMLAGGSERPGNERAAPNLPTAGSIGPAIAGVGVEDTGPGLLAPLAGGEVRGAERLRGTAVADGGTGAARRLVQGGSGGLGAVPGPGDGASRASGGPGAPSLARLIGRDGGGGSGGRDHNPGAVGAPPIGGGGDGGTGTGSGAGTGAGSGDLGGIGPVMARTFTDRPRGAGAGGPLPAGTGGGDGVGTARGRGGSELPGGLGGRGGTGGTAAGSGTGPGGEGIGVGSRRAPTGVYITTSGDYAMPSAVTGSNYQYHDRARRQLLDEINTRTRLSVTLGGDYTVIRAALLRNAPVLVFSGHRSFRLSEDQREELRQYVANGGTIWGDLSGQEFDASFQEEMRRTFGSRPQALPLSHPVYRSYYVLLEVPKGDTGSAAPFQAITVNDRPAVIITPNRYLSTLAGGPLVDDEMQEGALQAAINLYVYAAAQFRARQETIR